MARGLLQLGFQPGDRIGVWLPNTSEYIAAQMATAKAGLILVTINPAYRKSELEYALNLIGVKGLLFTPKIKHSN